MGGLVGGGGFRACRVSERRAGALSVRKKVLAVRHLDQASCVSLSPTGAYHGERRRVHEASGPL